jgi:hypothetical protein
MHSTIHRLTLTAVAIVAASAATAPAAGASTSPTLTLNQSAGKTAGGVANLGLDLKFANTGTDSPHNLTIALPPGLLANAAIGNGACLKAANTTGTACEIGTGRVTATPDLGSIHVPLPVPVSVTFYLVPPPEPGDLAGLVVKGLGMQIGATADVRIRPSGDPAGVGVTLGLVLPDKLALPGLPPVQISLQQINSTFDALRYPTTCPPQSARVSASVDSYQNTTAHTVTAPLTVTGCSGLSYSPRFTATAARDSGDRQVSLNTIVTQSATEAPSQSIALAFPPAALAPNLQSIQALCRNLAAGTCAPVGSVTATSPLYPTPLSGKAYLTGSTQGLSLTLVFPAPFPLTLTGAVDLAANSATFTGLPDIPLTNLSVSLAGGTTGLFLSTCQAPSGTAIATLTDQNGDKTETASSSFTVSGCGSGPGGPGSTTSGNGSRPRGATVGHPNVSRARLSGLRSGRPTLSFRVAVAKGATKLHVVTVALPDGLSIVRHHRKLTGVRLTGARLRSASLSHGRLVITLRNPVSALMITIGPSELEESPALQAKARAGRLKTIPLTVVTINAAGRRTTIHVQLHGLR